jgi:transcriptional antiterminator
MLNVFQRKCDGDFEELTKKMILDNSYFHNIQIIRHKKGKEVVLISPQTKIKYATPRPDKSSLSLHLRLPIPLL